MLRHVHYQLKQVNKNRILRVALLLLIFLGSISIGWAQTAVASNSGPICAGEDVDLFETGDDANLWLWSSNGSATFSDNTFQNPTAYGAVDGEIFTVEINEGLNPPYPPVIIYNIHQPFTILSASSAKT